MQQHRERELKQWMARKVFRSQGEFPTAQTGLYL